ncbi:PadR family transcriptional regulator [Ectobacillus ponti]|uniref:PadR family transcriptional regulator n=1 Tax=Ectobacillus ponti TaxID=2961894 RepID=A0AA42BNE9_9BACI|nr:PadR family transcriptional regulator [Ectobacillus ponti]MCP8967915.1 PadR family transcriptional regulator [Ectobacillus ponti]
MTRLMVLGLLRMKPMSGYEMQQLLQTSATDRWAGILPGSIYHALKKMDGEGLVRVASVETTGHRSKAIYEITEAGREEYGRLLVESFRTPSVHLPVGLYTGLSLLYMSPEAEGIEEALQEQLQALIQQREALEAGFRMKAEHMPPNRMMELTVQNMLQQYDLQIDFLQQILLEPGTDT